MRPVRNRSVLVAVLHLGELRAEVLKRPAEQARDVHLADAYAVGDLRLRLPLVKAELEDLLLLLPQAVDSPLEQDLVLEPLYGRVVVGLEVHDRVALTLVGAHGRVEAGGVVGPAQSY